MQAVEGLFGVFDTRSRTMDNCIASLKGFYEIVCVVRVESQEACSFDWVCVTFVMSPRNHDDFVPARDQVERQMSSDKTSSTGNCDFHYTPSITARNLE
jgi:hypothetical protein